MKKIFFWLLMTVLVVTLIPVTGLAADFGGRTVTIYSWDGPRGGDFAEGGWAEGRLEEAEELFNATIEFAFFPFGDYQEGLTTRLLAGESTHDIWLMQQRQFWPMLAVGAYYPISEVMGAEYYDNLPALSRSFAEALSYRGQTFGYGVDYGAVHPLEFTSYNRDLFEREGLPDLHELYEAGEWTWEMMTEIGIQATRDTTGDGEIDQWGIYSLPGSFSLWFAMSNDAEITREDEDGRIVFAFNDERALTALRQIYEWKTVLEITGGAWPADAFIDGNVAMINQGIYVINMINPAMEEDFGVVPLPMGPHAAQHRYPAHALVTWTLPANAEDPEALVELTHFLWPEDEYYERLDDYLMARVRDRKSFEVLKRGHDEWSGEVFHFEWVFGGTLIGAANQVIYEGRSASAAIAEVQPEIQAMIDELFDQ